MEQLYTEGGWIDALPLSILIECIDEELIKEIMDLERIKNGSW